ncbi:hypothetical protein GUJ93_ZPchr0001g29684 [Zizania palustris]|uniref:Uncharacterized protein n=1 Tax=Zizania palustris TaxID=103762 RepID=A0A8J5RQF1_ZIZPA|nr:hypothetical protein GUJ93_ZPchr0001g29684 [Zizania palustris]
MPMQPTMSRLALLMFFWLGTGRPALFPWQSPPSLWERESAQLRSAAKRGECKHALRAMADFGHEEGETKHLQALDGAGTRLRLFPMDDLLDAASVTPTVDGVHDDAWPGVGLWLT